MSKSGFAKDRLKSFVERVERLEEEKRALAEDIKEIYAEAKGEGFDTKIMRKVIALRKLDTAERQEMEAIMDLYMGALGMGGTPLGEYASRKQSADQHILSEKTAKEFTKAFGTPVELTDEEKAKGYSAAFVGKDGTRSSIGITPAKPPPEPVT